MTEATPGPEDGELYRLTSGWRENAGHKIYCFNVADPTSHRFNPMDRITQAPETLKIKRARQLADLIITNGQPTEMRGDTKMWNDAERHLLVAILLHLAAGDSRFAHLGAVRWLLLKGPNALEPVLHKSPSIIAQEEFEGWMRLSGETNFKYGVFSGLNTKFTPWQTDQMVALTETTDLDLEALVRELFTIYIAVDNRDSDSQLLGALLLNFFVEYFLEVRYEMKYPINMLLDEFTNFGKIQKISDFLGLVRKKKIGLVLGFQNFAQLEMIYSRKEAQVILSQPKTQVYFRQKEYREARELSDAIGRSTVEERKVDDGGRVRETVQGRNLATPDELINLDRECIVFTPSTNVLKLPLTSPTAYSMALEYPSPKRPTHEISEFVRTRGRNTAPQKPPAAMAEAKAPSSPASKTDKKSQAAKVLPAKSSYTQVATTNQPVDTPPITPATPVDNKDTKPEEKPSFDGSPERFGRQRSKPENDEDDVTKPVYKKPLEDWE